MQQRQLNRRQYFDELAITSQQYFIPYIAEYSKIEQGMNILEIGCGDGGNLLPFSRMGCQVTGVDMAKERIVDATRFFQEEKAQGVFIDSDVFLLKELEHKFNLIICHDVIEHIDDKQSFIAKCENMLASGGLMFMSFPAWQMPFGGHQQICRNRLLSHLPFYHLLPKSIYRRMLKMGGESNDCTKELLNIKRTRCSIEHFEHIVKKSPFEIVNRTLYFINPHYEIKFHLRPRRLWGLIGSIPYLRNFFTTSCFYILKMRD